MEALRREGDRVVPAGPKAQRTRAQLIDAAIKIFAEQGFQNSAVAQIAERAGVSLGTFYQYFRNRDEVLAAMVGDSLRAMETTTGTGWHAADGVEGLARIFRIYVDTYTQSIDIARVWENVSQTEPEMVAMRKAAARGITRQFAAELHRASKTGEIRPLSRREADLTARALSGMADRVCFEMLWDPLESTCRHASLSIL